MTIQMDGKTTFGTTPEAFTDAPRRTGRRRHRPQLRHGPESRARPRSRRCAASPTKKLSAQPNAGLPRDVQGRQFYMGSPEYMANFREALRPGGREVRRRMLRHDADAHQADRRRDPLGQPAPGASVHVRQSERAQVAELTPTDVEVVPPKSARTGRERSPAASSSRRSRSCRQRAATPRRRSNRSVC